MSEDFVETLERFDRGSGLEDSPIFPNLSVAGEGTDSPISLQRGTSVIGIENKIAQTRKEMHWKNMGAQAAGNKLANYLLGLGMNVFTLRDYYVPGRGLTGLFKVMETAYNSMEVMKAMADFGNPNSITDAAVGALCARTAVM